MHVCASLQTIHVGFGRKTYMVQVYNVAIRVNHTTQCVIYSPTYVAFYKNTKSYDSLDTCVIKVALIFWPRSYCVVQECLQVDI